MFTISSFEKACGDCSSDIYVISLERRPIRRFDYIASDEVLTIFHHSVRCIYLVNNYL